MEGWVINGGMSLLYCMCFQRERGPAVGCRAGADSCSAPGLSRGMWPTRGTATRAGRARGQAAATAGHWCTHSCMSVNTHFVLSIKHRGKHSLGYIQSTWLWSPAAVEQPLQIESITKTFKLGCWSNSTLHFLILGSDLLFWLFLSLFWERSHVQ